MDTAKTVTHVGLCAGYGGIELGLRRVIPHMRSVALCEIEAFAIANLVSKMEAGLMDPAPVWPDLKTFPWGAFRDRVDILTGGYPCQPFSAAGMRAGTEDPRHLWPWIAAGIFAMQPRICFFENVDGHISLGLSTVISDLEELGYETTWGVFSAFEVGAPHQRKRVFILANRVGTGLEGFSWDGDGGHQPGWITPRQDGSACQGGLWRRVSFAADCGTDENRELCEQCSICGDDYAECGCPGPTQDGYEYAEFNGVLHARPIQFWPSRPGEQQYAWEPPRVVGGRVANPDQLRLEEHGLQHTGVSVGSGGGQDAEAMADGHRLDRGAPAEGREHDRQVGSAGEELGDSEVRQDNGREPGDMEGEAGEWGCVDHAAYGSGEESHKRQTQPALGRDPDGPAGGLDHAELYVSCDNRTDELRLLGNGVVPATAELAFRTLMADLNN